MEPTWGAIIVYVVLGTIALIIAAVLVSACCPIEGKKISDEMPFAVRSREFNYTPYTGGKAVTGFEWLMDEVRR